MVISNIVSNNIKIFIKYLYFVGNDLKLLVIYAKHNLFKILYDYFKYYKNLHYVFVFYG